jgi:hypothetical protein
VRTGRFLGTLSDTFWILLLSVVVLFVFFAALGAFSPGEVVGLSVAVGVMALLWVLHAWWEARRHPDRGREPASVRARERRGF